MKKKGFKRAVSLAAAFVLGVGTMQYASLDVFAGNTQFLLCKSYNSLETNAEPEDAQIGDNGAYAESYDNDTNKALCLPVDGKEGIDNSISYTFSGNANQYVLSFDIKCIGKPVSGNLKIMDSSSKTYTMFNFTDMGTITLADGKEIGGTGRTFNKYDLVVNTDTSKVSVYVNGKCRVGDWYIKTGLPKSFKELSFSFGHVSEDLTNVYLDNVAVYTGLNPIEHSKLDAMEKYNEYSAPKNTGKKNLKMFLNNNCDGGYTRQTAGVDVVNPYDDPNDGAIRLTKDSSSGPQISYDVKTGGALVLQADVYLAKMNKAMSHIFLLRDDSNTYSRLLVADSDGSLRAGPNQTVITKIPLKQWVTLSAVIDFKTYTYDLYINGELAVKSVRFHRNITNTNIWIAGFIGGDEGGESTGEIWIDNMYAYASNKYIDVKNRNIEPNYSFETMENGAAMLKGNVAFESASQNAYYDDVNHFEDGTVKLENKKFYAELGTVNNAFKTEAVKSDSGIKIGDKEITDIITDGDKTFVCIKDIADALGRTYTDDVDGRYCLVTESGSFKVNESTLQDISDLLLYDFQTPEQVKEKFEETNAQHPRVLITRNEVDKMKKLYGTDERFTKWADIVIKNADEVLEQGTVSYKISSATNDILQESRGVLNKILPLSAAYFIKGDNKYFERAKKEMLAACEFPDWNAQNHYLDVGEMGAAIAMGYDWFYDKFTPEERQYFEKKLYDYALRHALNFYEGNLYGSSFWVKVDGNWGAVCNGGTAVAAAAIYEAYPEVCSKLLSYSAKSIAYMERTAYPDGGWEEGSDYTTYCIKYLSMMCRTMENTIGTDMNLKLGMYDVADYMISLDGSTAAFNFGDSYANHTTSDTISQVADLYGRSDLLMARKKAVDAYGLTPNAIDLMYYKPDSECKPFDFALDLYHRPIEVASMRSAYYDKYASYVGIQGGYTIGGHSHLDGGTFTIDLYGERWANNLTQDSYGLKGYFGSNETRFSFYRTRTEGHNCIVLNPREDSYGQDFDGHMVVTDRQSKPRGAYVVMDMASSYKEDASKFLRGIRLTDDRKSVVVRDEMTLIKPNSEVYWFMNVPSGTEIEIGSDKKTVKLTKTANGKSELMQFDIGGFSGYEILAMDARPLPTSPDPDGQNKNVNCKKVTIHGYASGEAYINMRMVNPDDIYINSYYDGTQPISEWTIPDGEITEAPLLSDLAIDGVTVDDFDPKSMSYNIAMAKDGVIGKVSAKADDGVTVEVNQSNNTDIPTMVKVYRADEPQKYSIYTIKYRVLKDLPDVNSMRRYTPALVFASANPQEENIDVNVADGNLDTRWSAEGEQWICQQFGSEVKIDTVAVAVMNGTTRKSMFDIQISNDGTNWTTVKSVATSGTTNDYEFYDIGGVSAKYVRLLGHGNSESGWNSITEFAVLGKK